MQKFIITLALTLLTSCISLASEACNDLKLGNEVNAYYAAQSRGIKAPIGSCLLRAMELVLQKEQIQGLRVHPELINETALVLRVAEELDRKRFGLKEGEKMGPAHIKAEVFERGLDPDGNPL